MPKVSDAHRDAVRRRIMDAAMTCLTRNGYRGLTTRELVAEAGVSTGTVYNYFPTKEDLYEALAEELLRDDIARLRAGAEQGETGPRLVDFLRDGVLADRGSAVVASAFRSRVDASEEARAAIARLNRFIVDSFTPLVEAAVAEGHLRDDTDAAALVELLDIVWDGLGRRAAADGFQTSYERVARVAVAALGNGVLADEPPPAKPGRNGTGRPQRRGPATTAATSAARLRR